MTKKLKRKKAKSKKSSSSSKRKKTLQEELQKVARPMIRPIIAFPRKAGGKMRLF